MSAKGHEPPVTMLSAWRLLSCVNRPFGEGFSGYFILNVSSHPKQSFKCQISQRSIRQQSAKISCWLGGIASCVLGTFRRSFGCQDSERCIRNAMAKMRSSTLSKNWNRVSIDCQFSSYWLALGGRVLMIPTYLTPAHQSSAPVFRRVWLCRYYLLRVVED